MEFRETPAQREFVRTQQKKRRLVTAGRVTLLIGFLVLWEAGARLGWLDDFIFSSPSRAVLCFGKMAKDGSIARHTAVTVGETLLSFFLVTGIGILGAVTLWYSHGLSRILEPYLVMLNSLPKSALAPILIVWLGSRVRTIVVAAVSVAVFGAILTLHNGFSHADPDQLKLIRSLGGTRKDILKKVLLPGAVPLLISNMKVNIGLCLVGVIIGEFLAADQGLGYLIIYGSQVFKMDMVVMSIVILCLISALLYQAIVFLERRVSR